MIVRKAATETLFDSEHIWLITTNGELQNILS